MSNSTDATNPPVLVTRAAMLGIAYVIPMVLAIDYRDVGEMLFRSNLATEDAMAALIGMVIAVLYVPLLAILALQRRNWARVALAVGFIASFLVSLLPAFGGIDGYFQAFQQSTFLGLMGLTSTVIFAAVTVMFFLPASNAWYRDLSASGQGGGTGVETKSADGLVHLVIGTLLILIALVGFAAKTYLLPLILLLAGLVLVKNGKKRRDKAVQSATGDPQGD